METLFKTAISFLTCPSIRSEYYGVSGARAHHVFASGHQPLVDDLRRVVSSCVNVHALFDNRVTACAERLPRLVSAWLYLCLSLGRMRSGPAVRGHLVCSK